MALSNIDLVTELYIGYYNRAPDPVGLNFWLGALAGGESLTTVANQFANSSESLALYPYLSLPLVTSPTSFVTQVYNNILNRAPDALGLAFWVGQLQAGTTTAGAFIATLEASVNLQTGTADSIVLANKLAVAENYTNAILINNVPFSQASAHAALAPVSGIGNTPTTAAEVTAGEAVTAAYVNGQTPGSTPIILTTGIDAPNLTTGNNTVLGSFGTNGGTVAPTFNAGDSLVAPSGTSNNNLTLSDNSTGGTGTPANVAATVSNFNAVNITSGEAIAFNTTTSPAGFLGLTSLNIKSAAAGANADAITTGAATAVTVTDTATASTGTLSVNGGSTVSVAETNSDGGAAALLANITVGATTAAAGAVTVNATDTLTTAGSAPSNISVNGLGATVNSTVNDGIALAANAGPQALNKAGLISVTSGAAPVVVSDAINVTSLTTIATNADAVQVTGGSTVAVTETVAAIQTATGISSITEGAVSVTGGAATTSVSVTQANVAAGALAVAASAGTTFVGNVTAVAASPGVQAVAGVTPVAYVAAATAVTGTPTITADGAVTIADKTNTATATSTITTVSLSGYGNSTFAGSALNSLSLAGTGGTLSITNGASTAATNTTLALAVNGLVATADSSIDDANNEITALNITTGATKSTLTGFEDTGLKAITVAGSSVLTLGANFIQGNDTALKSIAVSGAAGLTANLSSFGAQLSSITTSSSGVMALTLDDTTQTFVGSTGQDIISLAGDATKAITGGSATNNEVVLTAASSVYTAAKTGTNVTGFQILGVNDATAADVNTYNMHTIFTSETAIDLQSAMTGLQTFTGVAAGTTLAIDAAETAVAYSLFTPSNSSVVNTTINTATATAGITVGTLTLTDSNADGVATANFVSNAKTAITGVANAITTLADTSLSSLSMTGNAALNIGAISLGNPGQAVPVGVSNLTINNNTVAFTPSTNSQLGSTITTITDDTLGSLAFGGSNNETITNLVDNNAVNLSIGNTGAGVATITTLSTDANGAATIHNGLSNLTFTGSGVINIGTETLAANTAALVITNSGTATDSITALNDGTSLLTTTSLTLNGNVALGTNAALAANITGAIALADTAGVTVSASTDNAHIGVNLSGAASAATDTISVGNANDVIIDGSVQGHVNVTVGTGQDYIDLTGNGAHTAATSLAYLANVTLGAHTASDQIVTLGTAASAVAPNTVITGAAAGDIVFVHDASATAATPLSAGVLANAAAAGTLAQAVSIADNGLVNHQAATFVWSNNTYLIANSSGATETGTLASGDTLVELVGIHTITGTGGHFVLAS